MSSEASNAGQNPSTEKPLTIAEVSSKSSALMTKMNRPSVRTLIGKVKIMSAGFNVALIIASTIATMSAEKKLVTIMPGTV